MSTTPFEDARALHRNGHLVEAERRYTAILRHEPGHAEALHLLGVIALQTGRAEQGVALIGQAISLNSGLTQAHNNLGHGLAALGRAAEALASFERALALAPDFVDAHLNRAGVLLALGRAVEALASYDAAIALAPDAAEALAARGALLLGLVFCAFNASFKITPRGFRQWARILHAVPGSVLWLVQDNATVRANLRREAAERGLAPDRLVFAGHMECRSIWRAIEWPICSSIPGPTMPTPRQAMRSGPGCRC